MSFSVLRGAAYVLVHTPDLTYHNGTTQTTEKATNPSSEYLQNFHKHLRPFEDVVAYPPNQTYIGNITPEELGSFEMPWHDKKVGSADKFGRLGEIMPQDMFYALMKLVDTFELVMLEEGFAAEAGRKLAQHPLFKDAAGLKPGVGINEINAQVNDHHAEGLYHNGALVGCVKKGHDLDANLNAHVLHENLVAKASGVLALRNLIDKNDIDPAQVDYVIECSEEACGDMNQRGGGNFAKAIAEMSGLVNSTGADTRGFCAAPTHALIQAASLVKAGTFRNVAVVAGGSAAKLGMNGKDHVKKGLPILEDVLAGFAVLVSEDDGSSPVFRNDIVGHHSVGTGSAPQAVITSLAASPLDANALKLTDIDKYSVEMQNPDITKPAGAGDVPEANYKMIAALAVMRKEIERPAIADFIAKHGMPGWAPTQGHIPSGVPYLGFARQALTEGGLNRVMIVGKGSLFLGRMTNLFDGVSIVLERNKGGAEPEGATAANVQASAKKRVRIGLTLFGSEHGAANMVKGAELASREDDSFEIVLIGEKTKTSLNTVEAADDADAHAKMERMLDSGELDGCVTMHYNFPIGVATVGKVTTPGLGADMLLATTTGTSATNRAEAMVRNAIAGVITAKALGNESPSVGILNVDGANLVERSLRKLNENGAGIRFSESVRADGGAIMRGNDLLAGSVDVMVTDTLTGNILVKTLSAFTTGGSYEATGCGYGPGIGENYSRLVLILSRASGVPVVANSLRYAAQLAKGNLTAVARKEFTRFAKCGLADVCSGIRKTGASSDAPKAEKPLPAKEVVTAELLGIDIMELENAAALLMESGIYAESGMGCTGPVVLVSEANAAKAAEVLTKAGYIA
ncbi:MAG: glycine/sarcosine/betaine reductase complex component C subunit beta [Defluviitaleaceae bacterium]|nr:glycine/sarcosine/betaine reductase complex component C subunit beta [Defluviitaleaceae bacterium]